MSGHGSAGHIVFLFLLIWCISTNFYTWQAFSQMSRESSTHFRRILEDGIGIFFISNWGRGLSPKGNMMWCQVELRKLSPWGLAHNLRVLNWTAVGLHLWMLCFIEAASISVFSLSSSSLSPLRKVRFFSSSLGFLKRNTAAIFSPPKPNFFLSNVLLLPVVIYIDIYVCIYPAFPKVSYPRFFYFTLKKSRILNIDQSATIFLCMCAIIQARLGCMSWHWMYTVAPFCHWNGRMNVHWRAQNCKSPSTNAFHSFLFIDANYIP